MVLGDVHRQVRVRVAWVSAWKYWLCSWLEGGNNLGDFGGGGLSSCPRKPKLSLEGTMHDQGEEFNPLVCSF